MKIYEDVWNILNKSALPPLSFPSPAPLSPLSPSLTPSLHTLRHPLPPLHTLSLSSRLLPSVSTPSLLSLLPQRRSTNAFPYSTI